MHPDDRERVLAEDARTNETGEPFDVEYRLITRDGRTVWVLDQAVLLRDPDGGPLYWQGVRFDITDRMEAAAGLKPTACKPTTRLNVMLPDVPDLGFWRMECHGYQGAIELPGALAMYVGLARQAAGPGMDVSGLIVKAELAIEQRASKKPGKPRSDYVVPVIRTPKLTPRMLMSGTDGAMSLGVPPVAQIDAGAPASLAIESGSQRSEAALAPSPTAPPSDEFTEADITLVSADVRRAWRDEVAEAGWDDAVEKAIIHRATKGRTDDLRRIKKGDEWDRVAKIVDALIAGQLVEVVVDGAVRLAAPEKAKATA